MTFIPSVLTTVDDTNSTNIPLGSNVSFTGTSKLVTGFNSIILTIRADQNSQSGGISIQFSDDGLTFQTFYSDTYIANTIYTKIFTLLKKYFRISFANSGTGQTTFSLISRLSTELDSSSIINSNAIYNTSIDPQIDAFGRLRIANPTTLLDNKFPPNNTANGTLSFRSNNVIDCNLATGDGTAVYELSKVILSSNSNGTFTSQSRKYCVYQPGKSLLIMSSGLINGNGSSTNPSNCYTRLGYFDNNNGLFFQYNSTAGAGIQVVLRNNGADTFYLQNNWNIDKMNGTGLSSLNLDFSKTQLFIIDLEWLGVGRVRFGFYAFGRIYYCHQITNLNILSAPYITSINLPVRFQLTNTSGSPGYMIQICQTVISEGGYSPFGKTFSVATNPDAGITVGTTEIPLLAITGISTYNHENVIPTSISLFDTDNNNGYLYRIRYYLAPTSSQTPLATKTNVNDNSVVAYASASTSDFKTPFSSYTSSSIIIDQGYFFGRGQISFTNLSSVFTSLVQLTMDLNNNIDVIVITAEKTGSSGSGNLFATISWQEIY
jgi:hypothetical protein